MTDIRHVLDALPHAVSAIDAERRLVFANAAFYREAGIEPGALPAGTSLHDMIRLLAYRGLYGPGDPEAQTRAVLAEITRARCAASAPKALER